MTFGSFKAYSLSRKFLNMRVITKIAESLHSFDSISLSELDDLLLMKRVDKKFVLPCQHIPEILEKAKHDYRILEIEDQRALSYRTKYLDTPDMFLYNQHHTGRLNRQKVRYRTYEVSNTTFLEVKTKNNKGTTEKTRIETSNPTLSTIQERVFLKETLYCKYKFLDESLINSFKRIMLLSFQTKERISIDYNLSFTKNGRKIDLPYVSIIEVKREKSARKSPIIDILKDLGIQSRGFSKYCIGIALLDDSVRINSFKPNLLYLKKIKHAI